MAKTEIVFGTDFHEHKVLAEESDVATISIGGRLVVGLSLTTGHVGIWSDGEHDQEWQAIHQDSGHPYPTVDDSGTGGHNDTAEFLPKKTSDKLPAVRIAGNLVFVYIDDEGRVCVTVDTDDNVLPSRPVTGPYPGVRLEPRVLMTINNRAVFDNS